MCASLGKTWARSAGRLALVGALGTPFGAWAGGPEDRDRASEGLRLFLTDWSTEGREGKAGDGLGPLFNERSCVACHGQGGMGGAGGSRADVTILTDSGSKRGPDGKVVVDPKNPDERRADHVFPGFLAESSLVIHRFGSDPGYDSWRSSVMESFGVAERRGTTTFTKFSVRATYRNTPALFGSGLVDGISEDVLEAAGARKSPRFPEIKGRVARLKDGRLGRFGWKAQTASLGDFVRVACANELGLENPGHPQSPDPLRPKYKAPGLDLTEAECGSLTSFVASLPRPIEAQRPSLLRMAAIEQGREAFAAIGCADCHSPTLGGVPGIYSDLLLHDMGSDLSDGGAYYGSPASPGLADTPLASEWRTPPLWGLRASPPYLHDGRAATIAAAITQHGGEGEASATRYRKLDREVRDGLVAFLSSLEAPPKAVAKKPKGR